MARTKEQERTYRARYRKQLYLVGPSEIDPTGTHRRLQALMANGWSGAQLSRRAGRGRSWVWDTLQHHGVTRTKAKLVSRLYDELWDQEPPASTPAERHDVAYVKTVARKNGWLRPMAWDDDTIDDPKARPSLLALDPDDLPIELRAEMAEQLMELGYKLYPACKRARLDPRYFKRQRKEAA